MCNPHPLLTGVVFVAIFTVRPGTTAAQLPIESGSRWGQAITPAFEGWYRNPDGTYSLSFGYFNRNFDEVLEIPIGRGNFIQPGDSNQGQPTHFQPRRHWGVFAVKVPADFKGKVVWTLTTRGKTYAIPGSLHPDWQIDALEGEAGSGNTPPVVKFDPGGPEARGPLGYTAGPLNASVTNPLELTVWASDDGRAVPSITSAGRERVPVTLTWFKHQGPGAVTFSEPSPKVSESDGTATTTAMFSAPGRYVLRVRANDASGVENAGHAQCCWTNAFVQVMVSK
jgi:hypothetical protein